MIISFETRVVKNSIAQLVKHSLMGGCPCRAKCGRIILLHQLAKGQNSYFKMRDEMGVELKKAHKFGNIANDDWCHPVTKQIVL
jgi:hypothetical protein